MHRNRVRRPWEHQPRPSTSIAGRQTGRLSISQYTQRSNYVQRSPQASSHQQNRGGQPLFRPPAALNYLFESEIDENESNESNNSTETDIKEESCDDDETEYPDLVDSTGNSSPTANIIDVTTPVKNSNSGLGTASSVHSNRVPRTSQSPQSSQTSTNSSQKSRDIEAESWLQLRLAQEEAKKKRTLFAPFPPTAPQPRQPPQPPTRPPHHPPSPTPIRPANISQPVQSFQRPPTSWFQSRYIPIDRKQMACIERLKSVEEAFKRLEEKGQMTERCQVEKMEFEHCKAKADRDITLSATERKRMGDILRNIERREYNWSVGQLFQQNNDAKKKSEQAASGDVVESQAKRSLTTRPARVDEPKPAPSNTNPPTSHEATHPETAEEDEQPDVEQEVTTDDEVDEDDVHEDAAPEAAWVYNVYRTDIDPTDPDPSPIYISSHMNKLRAEAVMRAQIKSFMGSLKELTRIEFHATFEQNYTEQALEFASGRATIVRVERELAHEQPVKGKKRTKLELIPTKLYTVVEQVTTITDNEDTESPKYTEMPECFVLRKDANAQANRLMLAHLIAHLGEGEKFNLDITGNIDTEARLYLHELEAGERLYDKIEIVPAAEDGMRREVYIRVLEHLVRGPRN
ncbi:hypothetical protein FQN49_006415 [Arthroderma sp. PD_2]|nr:hypothetical protein FQN49_006415 [Arthroderma sp. PD_2]